MSREQQAAACPLRAKQAASRVVGGERVVVEPRGGMVMVLNEVGSRVWELADGTRSCEALARAVSEEYDVSFEQALTDCFAFLRDLEARNLLELRRDDGASRANNR